MSCAGAPPKTTSVITGSPANFKPNHLSVKVSTGKPSLCLKNKTTASQSVTYQGSVLVTIAAGGQAGIFCNTPNTATFSLTSNPKAALHLTCT